MVGENLTRFAHRRDASNSGARSRPWLHSGRRTCIAGICNTSTIATATGKHFRITWVLRDSDPECDDRIGPRYLRRVWLFSTSGQLPRCSNFMLTNGGGFHEAVCASGDWVDCGARLGCLRRQRAVSDRQRQRPTASAAADRQEGLIRRPGRARLPRRFQTRRRSGLPPLERAASCGAARGLASLDARRMIHQGSGS